MLVENSLETAIGSRISPKNTKADRISPENNKDCLKPIAKHQGRSYLTAKHQRLIGSHRKIPRPVESRRTTTTSQKPPQNTKAGQIMTTNNDHISHNQPTSLTRTFARVSPELLWRQVDHAGNTKNRSLCRRLTGDSLELSWRQTDLSGDRQTTMEIPKTKVKPNRNLHQRLAGDCQKSTQDKQICRKHLKTPQRSAENSKNTIKRY
jgi:hypothetical protein